MLSSIQANVSMPQNQTAFKCKASKVRRIIPDNADRQTLKLIMAEPVIRIVSAFASAFPNFCKKLENIFCKKNNVCRKP